MWGQYADHHKGVCLVFKKAQLMRKLAAQVSSDYDFFQNDVKYVNILSDRYSSQVFDLFDIDVVKFRRLKLFLYVDSFLKAHYKPLYFTKDTDWRNEREFRMLIFNKPKRGLRGNLPLEVWRFTLGNSIRD